MFSQNKPNMFGGFGQQPAPTFGTTTAPAFGSPPTNNPVFGAGPSTSSGSSLFGGQPTTSASLFGTPSAGQTFGTQQTSK